MLRVLSMSSERTVAFVLSLLSMIAMFAAQMSAGGCLLTTYEQPKIPSYLIKED